MDDSLEFSWLDDLQPVFTGLESRTEMMRDNAQLGKDRIWWCDGEYLWFRRAKSNPATLDRHNKFVADGDYVHVETQGEVEVWQLRPQSQFATSGKKQFDISQMDTYNVRRQAALAACRRDWGAFKDIMTFLRERITAMHGANIAGGEMEYADAYMAVIASVTQRNGPSGGEINNELLALAQKSGDNKRMISINA